MLIFHFILISLFFIPISYSKGGVFPPFPFGPIPPSVKPQASKPCFHLFTEGSLIKKSKPQISTLSVYDVSQLTHEQVQNLRPHQLVLLKPMAAEFLVRLYYTDSMIHIYSRYEDMGRKLTNEQKLALVMAHPSLGKKIWTDKAYQKHWMLDNITMDVIEDAGIAVKTERMSVYASLKDHIAYAAALKAFRRAYFFGTGQKGRDGNLAMQDNFTDAQLKEKVRLLKGHFDSEYIFRLIKDKNLTQEMVSEVFLELERGRIAALKTKIEGYWPKSAKESSGEPPELEKAKEKEDKINEARKPQPSAKIQKRKALIERGLNPYPYEFKKSITAAEVLQAQLKENQIEQLAGRLMRMRKMGQIAFFDLQDDTGQCQFYVKIKELSQKDQDFFKYADIGDIIGVSGSLFKTKTGENTLRVKSFQILSKTTQVLPEKYHGLENKESRYRHRHLDWIMNPESLNILKTRSKIIQLIRDFMYKRGFMEVETPTLQPIYGGAMALPFSTTHRALGSKLYLKISPELYLKRVIAGGPEKVFEIGKNFRNEGMDRLHNPEFTMLEYYEAYSDYQDQMKNFEDLVSSIVKEIKNTLKITYQGKQIDFTPPWPRVPFLEMIKKWTGLDLSKMNEKDLEKLKSKGISFDPKGSKGQILMSVFEHFEEQLRQPVFIVDFPKDISPLTKTHRKHEDLVERFEPYIAGMEIGNAYTELNDPVEQRQRLQSQERIQNEEERHPMDEDFLHAVGTGLPPLGGVGLGIDRLVMLLTDQTSIREVIWFPTMKAK